MKRFFVFLFVLFALTAEAQYHELGVSIGTANMLGDLGGSNDVGMPFLKDLEPTLFRPAAGLFHRYSFHSRVSIKSGFLYTKLVADDKLSGRESRRARNLNAETHIGELYTSIEFNLLKYYPGSLTHRFTPYIGGGIGLFYFNPKVRGTDIALQPLGTEGQGMPGFDKKYMRIQPNIPVTAGLKLNISRRVVLGIEVSHRFTFTDYIDDVRSDYVGLQTFIDYYGTDQGTYIYQIANPNENADGNTAIDGNQRGDPRHRDQYFYLLANISYVFGSAKNGNFGKMGCPSITR